MLYLCAPSATIESIIDDEDNFALSVNWIANGHVLLKVPELTPLLRSHSRNYREIPLGSF